MTRTRISRGWFARLQFATALALGVIAVALVVFAWAELRIVALILEGIPPADAPCR